MAALIDSVTVNCNYFMDFFQKFLLILIHVRDAGVFQQRYLCYF